MLKQKLKLISSVLLVSALFTLPTFAQSINLNIKNNESRCKEVRAIDSKSNTSAYSACHTLVVSAANTAVPAIASISSQTTGNAFNLSLSGLTVGQVLNLQSSTGSIYPKQINVSASSMSVIKTV